MRTLLSMFLILALCTTAWAAGNATLGTLNKGTEVELRDGLIHNHDGTFENGVIWQNAGVAPPDYGAFAECFDLTGEGMIVSVHLWLTQTGYYAGEAVDIYVWEGSPPTANVLAYLPGVTFTDIAYWPEVSEHVVPLNLPVTGTVSVGFWPTWVGELAPLYVAVDQDGPGGCPWTNIAPDIGYPDGWQHPGIVWGEVQSLGIGVTTQNTTAVESSSWSAINSLY